MTTAPRSPLVSAVVLAAIVGACVLFSAQPPPRPLPLSAPDSLFSAERAMRHVRAMAVRPHQPGTAEHARVRDYILDEMRRLGVTPELQRTTAVGTRFQQAGRVENVLARLPGTRPGGPAVMLAAHYDGVGAAPAASDDASGTSVLLEILRALRSGAPLEHDVIFLVTDGEEAGLLGAAAFVAEHPWARDVEAMINFEARGTGGQASMFQTGPGNLDQIRMLRRMPDVAATSLAVTVYQFLPNDTDLSEFFTLGKPGLNWAFADGVERYHTSEDDAEHIDPGSIQQEGAAALGMTRGFGRGPLPLPAAGNAVFFQLPVLGLVVYPESWARPLAVLAALLALVAIVRVARRERRWLLGALLGLVSLLVAAAAAGAFAWLVTRAAPPGIAARGARGATALGLVLTGVGLSFLCWAIIRRWVGSAAAALGPLLLWTGLTVLASWKLPGLSFVPLWPTVAATLALALASAERPAPALIRWLPAAVTGVIMAPIFYGMALVALGLVGPGGIATGALAPVLAWLLVPELDAIAGTRPWRTAFLTVALGLVTTFGGRLAGARADFPKRSLVVYAQNADSTDAWLATAAPYATPGGWNAAAIGANARRVAPDGPEQPGAPPRWLTLVAGGRVAIVAASAPRVPVASPVVTVTGDSVTADGRRITLTIQATPGTNSVAMHLAGAQALAAWVDGRRVDPARYRFKTPEWQLNYWGPGDSAFTISLVVPKDAKPVLDLSAHMAGLPALPGIAIPPRPAGVLPSQTGDMTVVYRRVTF